MQMKGTVSSDAILLAATKDIQKERTRSVQEDKIDKEVGKRAEAMLEQYRLRKSVGQTQPGLFGGCVVPPPQPVPPEIQQQRALSIFKVIGSVN